METFLAYGVTTLHKYVHSLPAVSFLTYVTSPSSSTVDTHIERSRLESGQFVGPRIFTTGSVLFGGSWPGIHEEITDMPQAYAALRRIKAEAGHTSISYKNYQLPSR